MCSLAGVVVGYVGASTPPPWTNILPVVTTVTLLQYCLVERQCLSRKQDEAYLCGNRKEIITAAHLVFVGLGCESGGGPLGH